MIDTAKQLFDDLNAIVVAHEHEQAHMSSAADLAQAIFELRDRWATRLYREPPAEQPPTDPRFWWLQIDEDQQVADLLLNVATSLNPSVAPRIDPQPIPLYGIVDENAGGIIAYAIGAEHATTIAGALEQLRTPATPATP